MFDLIQRRFVLNKTATFDQIYNVKWHQLAKSSNSGFPSLKKTLIECSDLAYFGPHYGNKFPINNMHVIKWQAAGYHGNSFQLPVTTPPSVNYLHNNSASDFTIP